MRIISQNGTTDISYDLYGVRQLKSDLSKIIAFTNGDEFLIMAEYSTEAKAKKAMEMLRENYGILCNVSVFATGSAKYMGECYSENELEKIINEYQKINFFQFPADEDVEV